MGTSADRQRLMVRVAKMYYIYNISQKEIAEELQISRSYVSQLIEQARREGVVEIRVNAPVQSESPMEERFRQLFGLKKVVLVPSPSSQADPTVLEEEVAGEACHYLDSIVASGMQISFSWGRTIYRVSQGLTARPDISGVVALPLCGGTTHLNRHIYVSEISTNLAAAYNGMPLSIPLPAILDSEEIKDAVCGDANIKAVLDRIPQSQVSLFTVGEFGEQNSVYLSGYIDDALMQRLRRKGAVGDIFARFIDERGDVCDPDLDRRTVSVNLDRFLSIPERICVVTGERKAKPLLAALRKGYANVLFASERTARAVLSLS